MTALIERVVAFKHRAVTFAFMAFTAGFLAVPAGANAALKAAAGGGNRVWSSEIGGEGLDDILDYVDTLTDWAILIALPLAGLGLTVAGGMLMIGNRRAGSVFQGVVIGIVVVVTGEGLAE